MLDLLRQCRQSDPHAQRRLFEMYGERLYRIAFRYTQDQMEAEDAVAEAFIIIFKQLPDAHFAAVDPFESWLRKIVINKSLELLRKRKSWQGRSKNHTPTNQPGEEDILANLSLQDILTLIQTLPLGYRTVLQLHALEGFTHPEIARALGISVGASKSQLSKARQYLQKLLEKSDAL